MNNYTSFLSTEFDKGRSQVTLAAAVKMRLHGNNKFPNQDRICPQCLVKKLNRLNWPEYPEDRRPYSNCKLCEGTLTRANIDQLLVGCKQRFVDSVDFEDTADGPENKLFFYLQTDLRAFTSKYCGNNLKEWCRAQDRRCKVQNLKSVHYTTVMDWLEKKQVPAYGVHLFPPDVIGNAVDPFFSVKLESLLESFGIAKSSFAKVAGVAWRDTPWDEKAPMPGRMQRAGLERFAEALGRISQIIVLRTALAVDRV